MSQKRWDVEVLFFSGPLAMQGPIWYQGPVIRIGRNPGTGGMNLGSYQGVAALHATIEAYEGHTIMISPIEPNVVRVAPHDMHCIAAVDFAVASDCADVTVLVRFQMSWIHYDHVTDLRIPAVLLC